MQTIRYQYITSCGFEVVRGSKYKSPGAVSMAYHFNPDGSLSFGVAFCSPKDRYLKSEGKRLAEERLASSPIVIGINGPIENSHRFLRETMRQSIFRLEYAPRWFRESPYAEYLSSDYVCNWASI